MDDKLRQTDRPPEEAPRATEPRDLLDRAKDEVASWFGDPKAASRRQQDLAVGDHSGEGPATYHADPDARIVDEINQRLTDDASLDAGAIEVASSAGAVTLAGQVTTSAQRHHAEELAHSVAGVSQVDNRLQVA
ncbi:MAG TPA: BON domain-containing protein [Caulobacteraceae bacterium]|jgi:osmotically-inducible protein OsmY